MKTWSILLWSLFSFSLFGQVNDPLIGFMENKGQLQDDQGNPLPNVFFKASTKGCDIYITNKGLTYLFYTWEEDEQTKEKRYHWHRVEATLEGANITKDKIKSIQALAIQPYRFYNQNIPNGVQVGLQKEVLFENVYPGIDWKWTASEEGIKYDFIVHPKVDPNQIKIKVEGGENFNLIAQEEQLTYASTQGNIQEGKTVLLSRRKWKKGNSSIILRGR